MYSCVHVDLKPTVDASHSRLMHILVCMRVTLHAMYMYNVHLCVHVEAAALTPRMYMVLGAYLSGSACLARDTAKVLHVTLLTWVHVSEPCLCKTCEVDVHVHCTVMQDSYGAREPGPCLGADQIESG